jgi:hypothetical protein
VTNSPANVYNCNVNAAYDKIAELLFYMQDLVLHPTVREDVFTVLGELYDNSRADGYHDGYEAGYQEMQDQA